MNIFNRIYITSSARYNVLKSIDAIEADALYFVEDLTTKCQLIYMGQNKIGGSFIVENNGYPTEPKCGVIYYISGISGEESDFVGFYDGSKWVSFFDGSNFVTKDKLIEVEEVVANTISKIIESTGIVNSDGVIDYNQHSDANYIADANSIDEATVLLDAQLGNVYTTSESDAKYQVKGNYLTEEIDPIWTAEKDNYYTKTQSDDKFATNETVIANEEVVANTFNKVVSGSGLVKSEGEIGYNQHSTANYISSATSIDEATVILDGKIKSIDGSSKVSSSDKVLSQDVSNGITSSLSLDYNSSTKKITLYGKNSVVVSEIDATDFIKDGMLDKVELIDGDEIHPASEGPYLVFSWNTDGSKSQTWISLNKFVDCLVHDVQFDGESLVDSSTKVADLTPIKQIIVDNEIVIANTFDALSTAIGVISSEGKIEYQGHTSSNYISSAKSIDEATVLLDSAIKGVENGYVKTDSDASLKSIQLSDGTNTSKVYTMTEGGVPTTYFENMNNGRLYLTGSDDSLGQIILDAKNIHPWSTGGYGNMGTAGNPWSYTYSNSVYTDRLASKNGTLWVQGLINNGNPSNTSIIDNVYFKANNVCPGSIDSNNNLGTPVYPWKSLNAIEVTIGRANGAYKQSVITSGVLKIQNTSNSKTTIYTSATSDVSLSLPFSSGTIALTSDTVDSANQLKIYEASLDGYYPLTMVESSSNLPKYESLFTKTNIKYNPVQNILETGRVHAHTYTYSEHPENASLVVYNSLDSGSQESIYTSMRPRVGFVYYDNHVDDRYCGQIVMDKNGYTFYRGTSDNSKNPDGTWKGTNDSVYKASNGGTPYAELRCGEIKAYVNDTWRNVISELDSVNTLANNAYDIANYKLSTDLSNITEQGEQKIKDVASTVIPTDTNWYGTQDEFDAITEYQEGVNYYIYD